MQSGAMTRMQLKLSLFGLSRQVCVCGGGGGGGAGPRVYMFGSSFSFIETSRHLHCIL